MSSLRKGDWPQFTATRQTPRGSQFRIGTRDVYVDVPSDPLQRVLDWIYTIEEESDTAEEAYKSIQHNLSEIETRVHEWIEHLTGESGNWLDISVRELPISNKSYNIQFRIDWEELQEFLDTVASSDSVTFTKKYQYIFSCRNIRLIPTPEGQDWISEDNRDKVRSFASDDIDACHQMIDRLRQQTSRVSRKCRERDSVFLFYLYSKDCVSSLTHIHELLDEGRITSCYRELRNILEELSMSIFYDKLAIDERGQEHPTPYPTPVHAWFETAQNNRDVIRNLRELRNRYDVPITRIEEFYNNDTISRKEVWNGIVAHLNTSLLIAGTATDQSISEQQYSGDEIDHIPWCMHHYRNGY